MLPGWLVIGVGVGLGFPNLVAAGTAGLPPEQSATGSGIISMARQVGLVLGVSILVSILGTGVADLDHVRQAWLFIASTSILSAIAALAMSTAGSPESELDRDPAAMAFH